MRHDDKFRLIDSADEHDGQSAYQPHTMRGRGGEFRHRARWKRPIHVRVAEEWRDCSGPDQFVFDLFQCGINRRWHLFSGGEWRLQVRHQQRCIGCECADDGFTEIQGGDLATGRWFTRAELSSGSPVAVVNENSARRLFGRKYAIATPAQEAVYAILKPYRMGRAR